MQHTYEFLIVMPLLFACGSPVTADQACADVASARCDILLRCNPLAMSERYGDPATCLARSKMACTLGITASGTAGTPAFEENCAKALPGQACADHRAGFLPSACIPAPGPRANAALCSVNGQCQSGFCWFGKAQPCGTCMPLPQPGDSCSMAGCSRGLVCASDAQTCATPVPAGGTCDSSTPCALVATCVGDPNAGNQTCQASIAVDGGTCDPKRVVNADCDHPLGLRCDSTSHACVAIAIVSAGSACGSAANGAVCAQGECADAGHLCVTAPADGQPCTAKGPACLLPSRCTGGTCALPASCGS